MAVRTIYSLVAYSVQRSDAKHPAIPRLYSLTRCAAASDESRTNPLLPDNLLKTTPTLFSRSRTEPPLGHSPAINVM